MDLAVYLKVLSRYRLLIAAGVVLALLLAVFSYARVQLDGVKPSVSHRESEVWRSASTLFVTQEGFPWGRSILDDVIKVGGKDGLPPAYVPRYGDPGRYSGLAQLYAALARSDDVQRAVLRDAPAGSRYETVVAKSADNSTVLPLIHLTGYADSPQSAEALAHRAAQTFRAFLARQQIQNGIPPDRRVQLTVVSRASEPELFAGRSLVRPAFVFLLAISVFIALAFVADNAGFTWPRPSGWTRGAFSRPAEAAVHAEALAQSVALPTEQRASAPQPAEPTTIVEPQRAESLRGAELRTTGEPTRIDPASNREEPPAEEPPARVQRWG